MTAPPVPAPPVSAGTLLTGVAAVEPRTEAAEPPPSLNETERMDCTCANAAAVRTAAKGESDVGLHHGTAA